MLKSPELPGNPVISSPSSTLTLSKKLDFIERAGRVQRCHTIPTLQGQNIAAHSFGVAWWCWLLSGEDPSARLLMAALQHDLAEHVTGDIPSPLKRELGINEKLEALESSIMSVAGVGFFQLTSQEARILRIADSLELMQHCVRERTMGNRSKQLFEMFSNISRYVGEVAHTQIEHDAIKVVSLNWSNV